MTKELEREIMWRLMEDPRASFSKIAKSLGVSTESVRQKVSRMRREGKLKFYCMADWRELGKRRITFILKVPLASKISVLEQLKALPIALEIHSGVLTNMVIMDISTDDPDKDTHEILKILEEMKVEVKDIFESEVVHFDSHGLLR